MAAIIWKTFYAALTCGGWGSEEFTLPHLLQDMGELVHTKRGGVVFSYSLPENWPEPNLERGWQEICDDLSSGRSGIGVLQSVVPGPMACRTRWMRGHTISSLQRRSVREPLMTLSSILPLRLIYADPHITDLPPLRSTSRTAYPMKSHLLPSLKATVKQETHLWRGSWTTNA